MKVVRVEYQPGRVLLSVHAMLFAGVAVRVLKFCVEGDPRVVRLTHWASAFDPRPSVMKTISRPVAYGRIDFSWLRATTLDRRNCSATPDCARARAQRCRNKGRLREGRYLPRRGHGTAPLRPIRSQSVDVTSSPGRHAAKTMSPRAATRPRPRVCAPGAHLHVADHVASGINGPITAPHVAALLPWVNALETINGSRLPVQNRTARVLAFVAHPAECVRHAQPWRSHRS